MLLPLFVALVIALVFYLILPIIGAYISRDYWRRFRERLIQLSLAPRLSLGAWLDEAHTSGYRLPGRYRLYGAIEAIEGENRIWIRSDGITATVDLGQGWFHMLAEGAADEGAYSLVERLPWSRVRVFPEGAKVFVGGSVTIEGGKPQFADAPGEALIVSSYDGQESTLLSRLIAGGRRGNEYWNSVSRVSITLGIGLMGLFLAAASTIDYFPTVIFLSVLVALTPALSLFPPGLAFFFLYMRFWKRGLAARTMRDLLRLPLRFFPSGSTTGPGGAIEAPLPEGGRYRGQRLSGEPPPGIPTLVPRTNLRPVDWYFFEPVGSSDPAARRIAIAGEPEFLARRSDREAMAATLLAGLSLSLGIGLNIVTAFFLWRLI